MDPSPDKGPIAEIREADFESEVLRSKQPVLVAFGASWSRPCQILDAALDEVATACAGSARVVKVNADDTLELSMWYEIESVPTLLFFVEGTLRARLVGTASKEAILAKLQTVLHRAHTAADSPNTHLANEHRK